MEKLVLPCEAELKVIKHMYLGRPGKNDRNDEEWIAIYPLAALQGPALGFVVPKSGNGVNRKKHDVCYTQNKITLLLRYSSGLLLVGRASGSLRYQVFV